MVYGGQLRVAYKYFAIESRRCVPGVFEFYEVERRFLGWRVVSTHVRTYKLLHYGPGKFIKLVFKCDGVFFLMRIYKLIVECEGDGFVRKD